jgi:hypothetical protein
MFLSTSPIETLHAWHDYFLLIGEASATLLGLVFISVALVAGLPEIPEYRRLFASSPMTHFLYAIALSAVCLPPWRSIAFLGTLVALLGVAAVAESVMLIPEMRKFHAGTGLATPATWIRVIFGPLAAGAISAISGALLLTHHLRAFGGVAAAAVMFAAAGVDNVWRLFISLLEQHHAGRKKKEIG